MGDDGKRLHVVRLVTLVDVDDRHDDGPEGSTVSLAATHEAVLADGRRVVLLDDRGWTGEVRAATGAAAVPLAHAWAYETREDIERTARMVVGPDEAYGGRTQGEMERTHWEHLAGLLKRNGVDAEAAELKALPHDVELSVRVRARLGGETARN